LPPGRTTRRAARRSGAMDHILQTIGEQLGENAFQLFEQVLNSVQATNSHDTQQFQLVTEDGQIAASIQVPPTHGRHRLRPQLQMVNYPGAMPTRSPTEPRASSSLSRSSLTPTQTILRWDQESRALQGCAPLNERLSWLIRSVIEVLKPSPEELEKLKQEQEEQERKQKELVASMAAPISTDQATAAEEPAVDTTTSATPAEGASAPVEEAAEAMQGVSVSDPLAEMFALTQTLANDLAHLLPPPTAGPVTGQASPATTAANSASTSEPPPLASATQMQVDDTPENGVVPPGPAATASADAPAAERVTIMIHGRPVDITDTGIDPTFLEALPDEMREEVLNQHFREIRQAARSQPGASASRPQQEGLANISPEFLDALPDEIRAEVLQQERAAQAAAAASTEGGGASDMDPATFLATLDNDPELRREVLLQTLQAGGPDFMATLPPTLLAELDDLRSGLRAARPSVPLGSHAHRHAGRHGYPDAGAGPARANLPARDAVQLLDKSGIATLVRLLFFPQQLDRGVLQSLLLNLCDHPKSRLEIVNYLLAILQDGTKDTNAVDKTFSHMTAKAAKSTPRARRPTRADSAPATPREVSAPLMIHVPGENVPNLVAQRCLEALVKLVSNNESVSRYFLIGQESLAKRASKKSTLSSAKGKERATPGPSTVLPLSILFGLLDRDSLLGISTIMDSLTGLMAIIARPLVSLLQPAPEVKPAAATEPSAGTATDPMPAATEDQHMQEPTGKVCRLSKPSGA
jgi:E3 ubiquitin-protein ligase HUWE1